MLENYSLIGLAFGVVLILLDILLLRRRKIPGKPFVVWFIIGVLICVVSLAPFILFIPIALFGAQYSISAVVAMGFAFFLMLFFYLHYRISEISSQLMKLVVQISATDYAKKQSNSDEKKDNTEPSQKR